MLSLPQVQDVCLYYNRDANTCRYLYQDDQNRGKFYCIKQRPIEKSKVDLKIRNFVRECRKKKVDPRSMNEPMGDNCPGYPFLKYKQQGYDVDKKKP